MLFDFIGKFAARACIRLGFVQSPDFKNSAKIQLQKWLWISQLKTYQISAQIAIRLAILDANLVDF